MYDYLNNHVVLLCKHFLVWNKKEWSVLCGILIYFSFIMIQAVWELFILQELSERVLKKLKDHCNIQSHHRGDVILSFSKQLHHIKYLHFLSLTPYPERSLPNIYNHNFTLFVPCNAANLSFWTMLDIKGNFSTYKSVFVFYVHLPKSWLSCDSWIIFCKQFYGLQVSSLLNGLK